MKRLKAFTLAEVLITLAIIGVVAAITAPMLNNAIQKSKVGPSLRKFINTMETANEHLLVDNDTDTITSIASGDPTSKKYIEKLVKFVKGSIDTETMRDKDIYLYDGSKYEEDPLPIYKLDAGDAFASAILGGTMEARDNSSYKGGVIILIYDINGFENKPNRYGKDIFRFIVDNNGSVIPDGSNAAYQAYNFPATLDKVHPWEGRCDADTVTDAMMYCAGSVADNNWKVIYKY